VGKSRVSTNPRGGWEREEEEDARRQVLAAQGAQALKLDVMGARLLDVDDGLAARR